MGIHNTSIYVHRAEFNGAACESDGVVLHPIQARRRARPGPDYVLCQTDTWLWLSESKGERDQSA